MAREFGDFSEIVKTGGLSPLKPGELSEGQPVLYSYRTRNGSDVNQWVGRISDPHVDTLGGPDTSATAEIDKVLFVRERDGMHPPTKEGIEKIFPKNRQSLTRLFGLTPTEYTALTEGDVPAYDAARGIRKPKK